MNTRDIVRKNNESVAPLSKYGEDYPSFPTLYREMTRWMEDWDNLLGDFFGSRWTPQVRTGLSLSRLPEVTRFNPAIDIREGDNNYTVTAELPGIDPKEVEITLQEGTLLIKGEKKLEQENKGEGYHKVERSYGSFMRSITLPKGVDIEHIDASFNNGLLTLSIPKLPEQKPEARKIEIKTSTPANEEHAKK
jgi:HSP20 family protein